MRGDAKRPSTASTACSATVRAKRASHACGITSTLMMVPTALASASLTRDGLGFEIVKVTVSELSSFASSRTGTDTVFKVSTFAANVSVPEVVL